MLATIVILTMVTMVIISNISTKRRRLASNTTRQPRMSSLVDAPMQSTGRSPNQPNSAGARCKLSSEPHVIIACSISNVPLSHLDHAATNITSTHITSTTAIQRNTTAHASLSSESLSKQVRFLAAPQPVLHVLRYSMFTDSRGARG